MGIIWAPEGGGREEGPVIRITSAPFRRRASVMAYPCFPEDSLERYLTGSRGSWVGPAVTRAFNPLRGRSPKRFSRIAAQIRGGSVILPKPLSPQARSPSSGPMKETPLSLKRATLAFVAGCCHIATFIAGAIKRGAFVVRSVVEAKSSARPWATLAIISALAGATTTRSASRARRICPISISSVRENKSEYTGSPERAAQERGVIN